MLVQCGNFRVPRSQCACPPRKGEKGNYPLDTRKHVHAANSYYSHKNTRKCAGGRARICRRARALGMHSKVCRIG